MASENMPARLSSLQPFCRHAHTRIGYPRYGGTPYATPAARFADATVL